MYVSTFDAKKYYSVSSDTLRRWANCGKIDFILTKGKHRRYFVPDSSSDEDCDETKNVKKECSDSKNFIYARVSSNKQKSDLQHQIQFLARKFPNHTAISDIGSGLNFRRKGLKTLLDRLIKGNIREVVVASKDRLARFGFELLEDIFNRFNAKIIIVNEDKHKEFKEELSEDIISIITFFTARYSGKRKYKNKTQKSKTKQTETETDSETYADTESKSKTAIKKQTQKNPKTKSIKKITTSTKIHK